MSFRELKLQPTRLVCYVDAERAYGPCRLWAPGYLHAHRQCGEHGSGIWYYDSKANARCVLLSLRVLVSAHLLVSVSGRPLQSCI